MAGQKYNKAYEAYQQAVYRDGRNPTFWCSIGVLYFQINQYRDALDAYSRAIRINPYISEVWFDLGSLYESCNNQISDAIDAYARAAELDPNNGVIRQRLELLKNAKATGNPLPAAPGPQDVHPTAYASAVVPPPGPPMLLQAGPSGSRPLFRTDSRGPVEGTTLLPMPQAPPTGRSSPGPFRGGPPPPLNLDDSRAPHGPNTLAPMEVDRPPVSRHATGSSVSGREGPSRVPQGSSSVLLHHPVPQQQFPEDMRHAPPPENYRGPMRGPASGSVSPPPHSRPRSPGSIPLASYPSRGPVGPGQNPDASRPPYSYDPDVSRDHPFDRRRVPSEREWDERDQRRPSGGNPYPPAFYPDQPGNLRAASPAHSVRGRGRSPPSLRERSASVTSPRTAHTRSGSYWDSKPGPPAPPQGHHAYGRPSPPAPSSGMPVDTPGRRYDPRFDAHPRDYERDMDGRSDSRSYAGSPDAQRAQIRGQPPSHLMNGSMRGSESPHVASMQAEDSKGRKRPAAKDRDGDSDSATKKDRKKRMPTKRVKEEPSRAGSPKPPFSADGPPSQHLGHPFTTSKLKQRGTPEPGSSNGSRTNGSVQPSPTTAVPPSREVDEDYDEGVADTLLGLSQYRAPEPGIPPVSQVGPGASGTPSRHAHRGSVSSAVSHTSPPSHGATLKRPISPRSEDMGDSKRARVDSAPRRRSSDGRTPAPSTRPSPIPFRQQPSQHNSPEERAVPPNMHPIDRSAFAGSPPSAPLQVVLPPHPRPIGTGMSSHTSVTLPSIATLSPQSNHPSPSAEEERMAVESRRSSQTGSPTSRGKFADVMHRPSSSPQGKGVPPSPPAIVTLGDKSDAA
jgi:general transcriptional corepressor CYC8